MPETPRRKVVLSPDNTEPLGKSTEDGKWPVLLTFTAGKYNYKWADALVTVRTHDGRVKFDEIQTRGQSSVRIGCLPHWNLSAPKHLSTWLYLFATDDRDREGEKHPWKALKRHATERDFMMDWSGKRLEGWVFLNNGVEWEAICQTYHDYLTARVYRAAECAYRTLVDERGEWRTLTADEKRRSLETQLAATSPPHTAESGAPSLKERVGPYLEADFLNLAEKAFHWTQAQGEWPIEFEYDAGHTAAAQ
jgi:hypothetical protein